MSTVTTASLSISRPRGRDSNDVKGLCWLVQVITLPANLVFITLSKLGMVAHDVPNHPLQRSAVIRIGPLFVRVFGEQIEQALPLRCLRVTSLQLLPRSLACKFF